MGGSNDCGSGDRVLLRMPSFKANNFRLESCMVGASRLWP